MKEFELKKKIAEINELVMDINLKTDLAYTFYISKNEGSILFELYKIENGKIFYIFEELFNSMMIFDWEKDIIQKLDRTVGCLNKVISEVLI